MLSSRWLWETTTAYCGRGARHVGVLQIWLLEEGGMSLRGWFDLGTHTFIPTGTEGSTLSSLWGCAWFIHKMPQWNLGHDKKKCPDLEFHRRVGGCGQNRAEQGHVSSTGFRPSGQHSRTREFLRERGTFKWPRLTKQKKANESNL